jgi:dTDP-4-dehydrorhamnose reductase
MRIAVIGAFGQLGSDLLPLLGDRAIALGHAEIEITDADSVTTVLDARRPTHVINCAAYNLVDRAEDEPEAALRVNAIGPRNLARWCAARDVTLLHVSTDYVFGLDATRNAGLDATKCPPWTETDPVGPVSAYGNSKLAGEYFVRSLCPKHFVVRTCGLYGHRAARGKGNFVETMLRLGRERPELRIVADQRCTPTSTADLARELVSIVQTESFGLYHATNAGECSWFEFASEIFRLANLPVKAVPIKAAEYGAKARRPDYSVLDCGKLARLIGSKMPSWHEALARYMRDHETPASRMP